MSIKKKFAKYVSLNVLGMLGLSCYIIADSYFIAKAQGTNGLTALNLVLPVYNIIFAIGSMIGVGSAIRYVVEKAQQRKTADNYLFNAIAFTTVIGLMFSFIGLVFPEKLLQLLGADSVIVATGTTYTRIFMAFSPVFMWNYVANAYVRNDGAPTRAMMATLSSSFFNIAFDYVLMFPLKMGMAGAALATALSPVVGIAVCMTHILSKNSHIRLKICVPSVVMFIKSCQVGISAFVGEVSSGVITLAFNFLMMQCSGNVGVAAYGVVANVALVVVAVFNGIALGSQPLISESYGKREYKEVKILKHMSYITAFTAACILYTFLFLEASLVVLIFNSEHNELLAQYAEPGVRLYFTGIFFAGLNIVGSSFYSATEKARIAFVVSMSRGFVLILISAFTMAALFGMDGIWLAYVVSEALTFIIMCVLEKIRIN